MIVILNLYFRMLGQKKEWVCWEHAPVNFTENDITFTVTAAKRMESLLDRHHGTSQTTVFCVKIGKAGLSSDLQETIHKFRKVRNQLVHDEDYNDFQKGARKEINTLCMVIFCKLNKFCNCSDFELSEKTKKLSKIITVPKSSMYHENFMTEHFLCSLGVTVHPWLENLVYCYQVCMVCFGAFLDWLFDQHQQTNRIYRTLSSPSLNLRLLFLIEMIEIKIRDFTSSYLQSKECQISDYQCLTILDDIILKDPRLRHIIEDNVYQKRPSNLCRRYQLSSKTTFDSFALVVDYGRTIKNKLYLNDLSRWTIVLARLGVYLSCCFLVLHTLFTDYNYDASTRFSLIYLPIFILFLLLS